MKFHEMNSWSPQMLRLKKKLVRRILIEANAINFDISKKNEIHTYD